MAFPLILGNLAFILISVGDVLVAGRHSTDTLAAISIATSIINCLMTFGIGVLSNISPVLSNYRGEGKSPEKYFYPSFKFAILLSTIVALLILGFIPIIDMLGFEAKLIPMIKDYFWITAFATFGGFIHFMAKEYLQAFEIVVFPNVLTVIFIFLNIVLNIIFAFGYGIIPEMGAAGLALASFIVRWLGAIILFLYCYKKIKIQRHKDKKYYKDLVKVGVPASLAILIEFVAFNSITVIMGRVAGIYAAAQNIICTITSISFMIPLAISNAISVKIGYANGAEKFDRLKRYGKVALIMSTIVMASSALICALFPEYIMRLFTIDEELIKVCVPIVYSLCFFQIFDGLQVTLSGIFRGLKNTKIVMLANFIGYWLVALPFGTLFAFNLKMHLIGYWYGIIIASIVLCSIMAIRLVNEFKTLSKKG